MIILTSFCSGFEKVCILVHYKFFTWNGGSLIFSSYFCKLLTRNFNNILYLNTILKSIISVIDIELNIYM